MCATPAVTPCSCSMAIPVSSSSLRVSAEVRRSMPPDRTYRSAPRLPPRRTGSPGDTVGRRPGGADMIEKTVANWHRHVRGELPGGLDALLHDDVVFYSPIVYTPQAGKAVTKLYLEAAGQTLP